MPVKVTRVLDDKEMKRHALDTYEKTLKDMRDKRYSDEEADRRARDACFNTMGNEMNEKRQKVTAKLIGKVKGTCLQEFGNRNRCVRNLLRLNHIPLPCEL